MSRGKGVIDYLAVPVLAMPAKRVETFGPIAVSAAVKVLEQGLLGDKQRAIVIHNEGDEDVYWSHDKGFTVAAGPRAVIPSGQSRSIPMMESEDTLMYVACAAGKSSSISGERYG